MLGGTTRIRQMFQDSVDESLRGTLGNDAAKSIYEHVRRVYGLSQQDFPSRLAEFHVAIDSIFGGRVRGTIERTIAKRLYWKLGLTFIEQPNATLQNYVDNAIVEKETKRDKPIGEDEMRKVASFVKNMKPTDHAILFYSEREMKRQVLFTYLKEGLENGEAAAYIVSQETLDEIREAMGDAGFNVPQLENSGALHIISYTQWYYLDGYTDSNRTNLLWKQLYEKVRANGFKGLRVTGETACFFERGDSKELVRYEQSLHKNVELPMQVLCAYDVSQVPVGTFYDLIEAHGNTLLLGPNIQTVS